MARRRFLVDECRWFRGTARRRSRHLGQVLRAEPGQQYEISDGAGVYLAEITSVEKRHIVFHVTETLGAPRAASAVTLYAALIKFDRFEWLVEKATEMGVAAIVPVNAARSEKGLQEGAQSAPTAGGALRAKAASRHGVCVRRRLAIHNRWQGRSRARPVPVIFWTRSPAGPHC